MTDLMRQICENFRGRVRWPVENNQNFIGKRAACEVLLCIRCNVFGSCAASLRAGMMTER